MTTDTIYDTCPTCGAIAGQPCLTKKGVPTTKPHKGRPAIKVTTVTVGPREPGPHGLTKLMRNIRKPKPAIVSLQNGLPRRMRRSFGGSTIPASNVPYRNPERNAQ